MSIEAVNKSSHSVQSYKTASGALIFQLPLEAFPAFFVYAYVVLIDEYKVLIDCGSNYHHANDDLKEGFETISNKIGQRVRFEDLTHILITHGHIDHFGGLAYLRPLTKAKVGVHELDRRILTNYEERLEVVAKRLREYLIECGLSDESVEHIYHMYMMPKALFKSVDVDFTFEQTGMQLGPFEFLHVPGHCAGLVAIRLEDILFSADHVINGISPHQSPEQLSLNTGLTHYLDSLEKVEHWAADVRLALASHKTPITDLTARIGEIRREHADTLARIIEFLERPCTVADISKELFSEVDGYNVLLALEETGAHVEYLAQRGLLGIDNLEEFSSNQQPVAIRYIRLVEQFDPTSILNQE